MYDLLKLISSKVGKEKLDVWEVHSEDYQEIAVDDIVLENTGSISMITGDDKVYGVTGSGSIGSIKPTAISSSGTLIWIFEKPVSPSALKGTGLSPDLTIEELSEFEGHYVSAQDLILYAFPDNFEIGFGTSSEVRPGKWRSVKCTKSQFISQLSEHKEGDKDGQCFTQGALLDGKRSSMSVFQNFVMVFDIDTGMSESDITSKLSDFGYEYLLYSTHSHLKTESKVKRDSFFKWSKEDASKDVKVSSMKSYLTDFKRYLPSIVEDMSIKEDAKESSNGVMTLITHAPMPKFRIVFFLNTPFIFQGKFNQKERILEWKERYYGLATVLDLPIDKSCVDPGRLFYFGRHEKGSQYSTLYAKGNPLVLDDIERVTPKEAQKASKDVFESSGSDMGGDNYEKIEFDGFNLKEWAVSRADIFNIQDALEDSGYDEFRDVRSHKDGIHIQCPYEDGHTELGGNGTYILNARDSDEGGFIIHCMHDSCSGRDRLDFLKGLLEEDHLTIEDLSNNDFMCEEEVTVVDSSDKGETPKTSKKKVKKFSEEWFVAKIKAMTERSENQYNIVKHLVAAEGIPEGVMNGMLTDIAKATNVTKKKITGYASSCQAKIRKKNNKEEKTDSLYYMDDVREVVADLNKTLSFANSACKVLRKTHDINGSVTYEAKSVYEMNHLFSNQLHSLSYRGETKEYTSFDLWLKSPERNTCEGLTYQPRKPERIYKSDGNTVFLNTYSEFTRWEDEDPECSWSLMKDHIFTILCCEDNDLYMRFILFFANIVQNPDKKYAQTLIIKGEIGCGKSIVMDYLREIMGRSAIEVNDSSSITGKFNEHLAEKLLVVLDESDFKKSMNKLKNIISSKTLEIEPKGMAKIWVNNCVRIVVTTNSGDTVEVSLGTERRFYILACSDYWVQPADADKRVKEDKVKYFNAIQNQMEEEGGLDQMFYDLKTFNPEKHGLSFSADLMMAPMTEGLREESATSVGSDISFISSFIQNGYLGEVPLKDLEEVCLHEKEESLVPRKIIQEHFYANIDKTRSEMPKTPFEVKKILERVAGIEVKRNGTVDYPGMVASKTALHAHCYRFPPRKEMIKHMEKLGYVKKGIDIGG